MTKKALSKLLAEVTLKTWDKSEVVLSGDFKLEDNGDVTGRIELTPENLSALETINHGRQPVVTLGEDGLTQVTDFDNPPTSPTNDRLPLWKWVKPNKKAGTIGRWVPTQSAYNRESTTDQVTAIKESIKANGFLTHLARKTIGKVGGARALDGGHTLTATSQLNREGYSLKGQYMDLLICNQKDLTGFDEIHRNRSVADVLQAHGKASEWERDTQILLSSLLLLCSSKGLNGSGKYLPHIKGANGKPRKLTESEIVGLLNADYPPFTHIETVFDIMSQTVLLDVEGDDDHDVEEVYVQATSGIQKYSLGCWFVCIVEALCADCDPDKVKAFILDVATLAGQASETSNKYIAAVNAWGGKAGRLDTQAPSLAAIIIAACTKGELPKKRPSSKQAWAITEVYNAWVDSQATGDDE